LKKDPTASHISRLKAVMWALNRDYEKRRGQKKFAEDIGVNPPQLNNILRGTALSKKVADATFHRFKEEGVTLEFLYHGHAGHGMKPEFEQKLLEWQHHHGKKIFSSDDAVFRQIPLPQAPTMKAKTPVEIDPIARLQEPVDAVRRLMIDITEPTLRSALAIAGLGVVITKAQELIAELQIGNEASKPG
jgi:hypothetical protein